MLVVVGQLECLVEVAVQAGLQLLQPVGERQHPVGHLFKEFRGSWQQFPPVDVFAQPAKQSQDARAEGVWLLQREVLLDYLHQL